VPIPFLLLNPFGAVQVYRTAFACDCTSRWRSVSITIPVKSTSPGRALTTRRACQDCTECQRQRRVTVLDRIPIGSVERPASAFDTVLLDCCGPIEPSLGRGHHYILVMVDHCSRWVECIPLKTLTAKETCSALNIVFQRIGIPRVVISENSLNFVSNLNKIFFSKFGIELRNSTPLHPQGNSLAERLVQNVKKCCTMLLFRILRRIGI